MEPLRLNDIFLFFSLEKTEINGQTAMNEKQFFRSIKKENLMHDVRNGERKDMRVSKRENKKRGERERRERRK